MFRTAIGEIFDARRLLIAHDAELAVAQGATFLTARHRKQKSDGRSRIEMLSALHPTVRDRFAALSGDLPLPLLPAVVAQVRTTRARLASTVS